MVTGFGLAVTALAEGVAWDSVSVLLMMMLDNNNLFIVVSSNAGGW